MAASQLNYILGDTEFSYVVGHGSSYSTNAHTREGFCTEDDSARDCNALRWGTRSLANPNVRTPRLRAVWCADVCV